MRCIILCFRAKFNPEVLSQIRDYFNDSVTNLLMRRYQQEINAVSASATSSAKQDDMPITDTLKLADDPIKDVVPETGSTLFLTSFKNPKHLLKMLRGMWFPS